MQTVPTRERLITAAISLFSEHGFQGAAVRDICNQARVNPGAVSYHFDGKRQLYRAAVRTAIEALAASPDTPPESQGSSRLMADYLALAHSLRQRGDLVRLVLRDLADGGQMTLEALTPVLNRLRRGLAESLGASSDSPNDRRMIRQLLLHLASPIVLATVAWPVLSRALGLSESDLEELLAESFQSLPAPADAWVDRA